MSPTETRRHVAIATCEQLPEGDPDDALLVAALRARGVTASVVAWSDPSLDWLDFDATVLRSTWDYTLRRTEFLAWASQVPRLYNPVSVVHDNSDKRYLTKLAAAGLPVVPTTFAEPGEQLRLPTSGEFVLKPSVGAGSRGAGRFDADSAGELDRAREHCAALHAAGRTVMLQPYQSGVDEAGESALIYLDGRYSHCIGKAAMLEPGRRHEIDTGPLYIDETITAREADPVQRKVADRVLAELGSELTEPLLYARIDLLPGAAGPLLVEAELTEPSLFLEYGGDAAGVLAEAILARIG